MTDEEFQLSLSNQLRSDVAKEIAGAILFCVAGTKVRFDPKECAFSQSVDNTADSSIPVIYCLSWQRLHDVLVGKYDLMQAFLDREIWTNGYLPVVFRLFAVFQTGLTIRIPE